MAASVKMTHTLNTQSPIKMFFILTVYSYSFLPYLYNLSHRLTELNVSLFSHKTWHKVKSRNFSSSNNLLAKSINQVI